MHLSKKKHKHRRAHVLNACLHVYRDYAVLGDQWIDSLILAAACPTRI